MQTTYALTIMNDEWEAPDVYVFSTEEKRETYTKDFISSSLIAWKNIDDDELDELVAGDFDDLIEFFIKENKDFQITLHEYIIDSGESLAVITVS